MYNLNKIFAKMSVIFFIKIMKTNTVIFTNVIHHNNFGGAILHTKYLLISSSPVCCIFPPFPFSIKKKLIEDSSIIITIKLQ